jgi:hypothetical protein
VEIANSVEDENVALSVSVDGTSVGDVVLSVSVERISVEDFTKPVCVGAAFVVVGEGCERVFVLCEPVWLVDSWSWLELRRQLALVLELAASLWERDARL